MAGDAPERERTSPPRRRVLRVVVLVLVAAAIVALLFGVVFPWVETLVDDPTLGA